MAIIIKRLEKPMRIKTVIITILAALSIVAAPTAMADRGTNVTGGNVVRPGVEVRFDWPTKYKYCTLGPAVQFPGGYGFLTAAHCGMPGQDIAMEINGNWVPVGEMVYDDGGDDASLDSPDIAVIKVTNPSLRYSREIWGMDNAPINPEPLTYSGYAAAAPQSCGAGAKSGIYCAEPDIQSYREDLYIGVAHATIDGDSGAPVFARDRDGSVTIMGVQSSNTVGENVSNATFLATWQKDHSQYTLLDGTGSFSA